MLRATNLVARYSLFALLATAANFLGQSVVLQLTSAPHGIALSILSGTLIGFAVKYVLDKKFIFFDNFASTTKESIKVVLYGVTAIFTTLIFWSFELGAFAVWHNSFAKYAGGAVGLSIGYVTKYLLDRRFVFLGAT
jgi:putative flippase GtrA